MANPKTPKPPKPATAGARRGAARSAPAADAPVAAAPGPMGDQMKKREFLERVTAEVGGRKGNVKDVVEATLKVLGDALQHGADTVLPPLGRLRVVKLKDGVDPAGKPVTIKLRRNAGGAAKSQKDSAEALAEADEHR